MFFLLIGCTANQHDDDTIILGLIEIQNYKGFNELITGRSELANGKNSKRAVEILFKSSELYKKSIYKRIDDLINKKQFRKALFNIDSELERLKQSKNQNDTLEMYLNHLKSNTLRRSNQFQEFLSFNKQCNFTQWLEKDDILHRLYFLKFNWLRADYLRTAGSYEEAKAYSYLGLFLLEKYDLKETFPKLYIQYCNLLSWCVRENNKKGTSEQIIFYYKTALSLSEKYLFDDLTKTICTNLADIYFDIEDSISGTYYAQQNEGLVFDAQDFLMQGNRHFWNLLYNEAIQSYKKGLLLLDSIPCDPLKTKFKAYIAEAYHLNGKLDSAHLYLDLAWDMESCSQFIKEDGAYYIRLIEFDFYKTLDSTNQRSIFEILNPLIERRRLGYYAIAGTDSQHLSDFLVTNTSKSLEFIIERIGFQGFSKQQQTQILNLIADTKRNKSNLKTIEASTQKSIAKEIAYLNQRIEKMPLNGIHLDSVYYKLSQVYDEIDKSQYTVIPSKPLDLNKHSNSNIVNFLYDEYNYFMYIRKNDDLQLFKFDAEKINLYVDSILTMIQYQDSNLSEACANFRQFLNLDNLDESELNILPDGDLIGFPFSLLFENSNVEIYYNYSLLNTNLEKELVSSKSPPLVLSYTDLETLKILDEELEYIELPEGYKECNFIKDSIFNDAVLLSGEELTIDALENNLSTEICHISTHALSDTSSQYDVSILIRDNEGKPIPYYGYELLKSQAPKFVFLNACITGVGYIEVGEGVYSFSKYCQLAGSETVINTLWEVSDVKAAEFSKEFYRNWKKGYSALESFSQAVKLLKSQNLDPYHWAPFVLEGNPNVYLSKN